MRALDAPRARVLHDATPEPTRWPPWLWPTRQHLATHSPPRSIAPNHPGTLQRHRQGILAALRRPQRIHPRAVPPKPLPLATWPLEQRVLIRESVH